MTSGNRMATAARYSENTDQQSITKVRAITTRNSMSLHFTSLFIGFRLHRVAMLQIDKMVETALPEDLESLE